MATVKLTKDIRRAICSRILRHRFSPIAEELIEDQRSHAARIYKDVYPKGTLAKMEALPKGWLSMNTSLSVRFGEDNSSFVRVEFNGMTGLLGYRLNGLLATRDAIKKPRLAKHKGVCAKVYPIEHTFSIEWEKLDQRRETLEDEYQDAIGTINVALSKVTTVGALVTAWPEVASFAQSFEPTLVPALPRETLNELLNLPVVEAAA